MVASLAYRWGAITIRIGNPHLAADVHIMDIFGSSVHRVDRSVLLIHLFTMSVVPLPKPLFGALVHTADGAFIGLIDPTLIEIVVAGPALPIVAADLVYGAVGTILDTATVADAIDLFRSDDRETIAVVEAANSRRLVGCVRARDAFAAASSHADAQRWSDLGTR